MTTRPFYPQEEPLEPWPDVWEVIETPNATTIRLLVPAGSTAEVLALARAFAEAPNGSVIVDPTTGNRFAWVEATERWRLLDASLQRAADCLQASMIDWASRES